VKTISLKKVSAVAVASLGFGLLSVVPAQAAATLPIWVDTATTVGGVALTSDTATVTRTLNTQVNAAAVKTISAPAGSAIIFRVKSGAAFETTDIIDMTIDGATVQSDAGIANAVVPTTTRNLPSPSVTTTYRYVLKVYVTETTRAAATITADLAVDITVSPLSSFSAGVSTAYSTYYATAADGTAATDAVTVVAAGGTADAGSSIITADLNRADGTPYASGTVYASVSGPGKLAFCADGSFVLGAGNCAALSRSASLASDSNFTILTAADGTSGVGTIEMYIILADGVTKVALPTKKVVYYGTVATLEAKVLQGTATPGVANGCATANTCTQATLALTPAVTVVAKDANGVVVPGLTITATPADTTIVASASAVIVTLAGAATDKNGLGYYNSAVTGGSATQVGKSTTIVYSTVVSALLTIKSAPVTIALAGTPKAVTWALDKTAYAPGEKVVITVSAKDSAGNAAADGTYANLFAGATTASGSVTGSTPAASVELVGGKATYNAFAPGTTGTYTIENTTGSSATADVKLTGSIKVNDPNAALVTQIDALNAKIVALNALIAKIMKKLGVK
jgi:hypothetical protein